MSSFVTSPRLTPVFLLLTTAKGNFSNVEIYFYFQINSFLSFIILHIYLCQFTYIWHSSPPILFVTVILYNTNCVIQYNFSQFISHTHPPSSGLWRGIFNFHKIYFLSHSHLSLMHTITITMIIIVSTVHQCTTLCFDKQPRTNNQFSHWPQRFDHNFMTFRDQR